MNKYLKSAPLFALVLLCACATEDLKKTQVNNEFESAKNLMIAGQQEQGMVMLQQLISNHPENLEYKNYYKKQLNLQISKMLIEADLKRKQRHFDDANSLYSKVLDIDNNNPRALEGLNAVNTAYKHENMLKSAEDLLTKGDADGAQHLIRNVLAEDANNPSARALFESIEQKHVDKINNPPRLKSAFKKPITLEFKDVAIKSVFEFIAKAANINFAYDPELQQDARTSIFVRNTSIEDAIQVILTTHHLDKKVLNDNTLLIYPASLSANYQELYVRSFYLGNIEAKRALNLLKTVTKAKDIYIDEKLNTLVMRDSAENIRLAEKLIMSQDLAEPEVMLEVEVMEINRKNLENIGIQYPTKATLGVRGSVDNAGVSTLTTGQLSLAQLKEFNSDYGVFTISDPVLALNMLNQYSDTNLLASPHIRVKNREKAKILVGDKIPLFTSVANSTGFVSETISYLEVGIKLDVEPTVLLNDEVSIKVALEVSNQTDQVKSGSGTLAYSIGTRNANTVLRLKNGETQVLAGLFRDDEQNVKNKVPGLSSLPLIGGLFTDKNKDKRKKEIILLITPRVLNNIAPSNAIYSNFPSGIENNASVAQRGNTHAVEASIPVAAPAKSPQEIQTERAQLDKSFAESLMQAPNTQPAIDAKP